MEPPGNNLLLRLHKWAWRQDENFLTEVLGHLLQHLLDHEPEAGVRVLQLLTGGFLAPRPEEARLVEVRTQVFSSEGTPDLELRTSKQLAYVEVKSESEVSEDQLVRYRRLLRDSGVPATALVLLTRYPVTLSDPAAQPDTFVRWYQMADWLDQERHRYAFQAVSAYLVDQFLGFLRVRNMTMGQVTWELTGGVRALRALGDMLYEVASACGCQARPHGDRNYMGVYLDRRSYWVGINYDRPEVLEFATDYRKVDPGAAARLGIEGVFEWEDGSAHGWRRQLNLDSEDVHFFARSKASQMQLLENFLRECLETVRRIEVPGGEEAPVAEEPEPPSAPPTAK
jgi:hypothetical protein